MAKEKKEKALHSKQIQAIELLAQGIDANKVALEIGVDKATISRWRHIELFNETLIEEMKKNFRSATPKGYRVLIELLESKNEQVRLKAATEILDRGGMKVIEQKKIDLTGEITNKTVDLSSLSVEELKKLAEIEVDSGTNTTH